MSRFFLYYIYYIYNIERGGGVGLERGTIAPSMTNTLQRGSGGGIPLSRYYIIIFPRPATTVGPSRRSPPFANGDADHKHQLFSFARPCHCHFLVGLPTLPI